MEVSVGHKYIVRLLWMKPDLVLFHKEAKVEKGQLTGVSFTGLFFPFSGAVSDFPKRDLWWVFPLVGNFKTKEEGE